MSERTKRLVVDVLHTTGLPENQERVVIVDDGNTIEVSSEDGLLLCSYIVSENTRKEAIAW